MATVANRQGQDQRDPDHQAGVVKKALTVAGASAAGVTGIIGAAAYGALPASLAYLGVSTFGLIMLGALIIVWIYLRR